MKTWNQTIPLLRNDEQKIVANGYRDLRVDRVLGGSIEGLDAYRKVTEALIEKFSEPCKLLKLNS